MTALAVGLVVLSSLAHATWNFLGKSSRDTLSFFWAFATFSTIIYFPLALSTALSHQIVPTALGYVAVTVALHQFYFALLAAAYQRGDLSVTYPVARGTGLALIPIGGAVLLHEHVSLQGALGIVTIIIGVAVAHTRTGGKHTPTHSPFLTRGSLYALLTGIFIACYSVWDKHALEVLPPVLLDYGIFAGQAIVLAPYIVTARRKLVMNEIRERPLAILVAAILSPLAYLLVLTALTFSRVSYIGPAREVGIVVGALLGIVILKEPHGRNRMTGACLVVGGVALLALAP